MPRHRAYGRHRLYHSPWSARGFLSALAAALGAVLVITGVSGTFTASARQQTPAARTVMAADRAAESPAAGLDPAVERAQLAALRPVLAAARARAVLLAHTYTVRAGDSLSHVAQARCGLARDWTGIYAASRARGWTAANANNLTTGQHLYLTCAYLPSMLRFAPAPPPPPRPVISVTAARTYTPAASSGTYRASSRGSYGNVSASSYGGYQACVITRESGGQSQVMNASGHYGLYQFDYGTWVSGGGSGADFGHAGVAEQNRVFAAVYAARGTQPWSPSDGC